MSLSSITTEAEERLFGQAKALVSQASNRHPDNVMLNMLTRLQSKQLVKDKSVIETLSVQESRVSKAAAHIPKYSGTVIHPAQISHQLYSWQLHLKRISSFLVPGMGVWWSLEDGNYRFFDGYHDPNFHDEGPHLLHHRNTQIQDLYSRNESFWQQVIVNNIPLPTISIKIFDHKGNVKETRRYNVVTGTELPASGLCNGSTGLNSSLGQSDLGHTSTNSSPVHTTCTKAGSGFQASSLAKEETVPQHYTHQQATPLAFSSSLSLSCSDLRSNSTYQTSGMQSLSQSCPNLHVYFVTTSSMTLQNRDSTPNTDLQAVCPSASVMTPTPFDKQMVLETDIHTGATDSVLLSTNLGKALQNIIGSSQELQLFDKLRKILKDLKAKGQKLPTYLIIQHNKLQSQLQVLLLKTKSKLRDEILQCEESFYKQHHRLPTKKDSDQYSALIKQQRMVKHLLAQWNITL